MPGVGTSTIDGTIGVVTFQPLENCAGTPDPITVVATTATGATVSMTYQPTVIGVTPVLPNADGTGAVGEPVTMTSNYEGLNVYLPSITLVAPEGARVARDGKSVQVPG